jgi:DNA-directed RNA polymerase subunit M/transcription elongation factor TFIIS
MRFCDVCENRLEDVTTSTELYYECTKCKKKFPATVEDSLRFVQIFDKKKSKVEHATMLANAAFDNNNPREFVECPECKNQITSYVIIGEEMKYVRVCTCGHQF